MRYIRNLVVVAIAIFVIGVYATRIQDKLNMTFGGIPFETANLINAKDHETTIIRSKTLNRLDNKKLKKILIDYQNQLIKNTLNNQEDKSVTKGMLYNEQENLMYYFDLDEALIFNQIETKQELAAEKAIIKCELKSDKLTCIQNQELDQNQQEILKRFIS